MDDDKGTSLLFINSENGKKLFENIDTEIEKLEVDINRAVSYNKAAIKSATPNKNRNKFFKELELFSFDKLVKNYCLPAICIRVVNKTKRIAVGVAKKRQIPIFHMEAGNRCFDQRVPEETNRKIVDHISDINLTYSDIAREYLLREGLSADRVIKTGSPMFEVLQNYLPKVEKSEILTKLNLKKQEYFVVSAHREENISSEKNFQNLCTILNDMAKTFKFPIIVSSHPRTRKMIEAKGIEFDPLVRLEKPFSLSDYLALQVNAKAVLSDSGTISEESSILGFPALNIREAHERPEAMEEASVMMVGLNPERIQQGLLQLDYEIKNCVNFRKVADYSMPNVSDKVVRIILSYTDYIKRVVWSERN
ncbi:MAG: UDP-N-acetyl glucosamine 2-epimerase [Treponema sp.]|nr:UDP-N-acetyl glucosamine 2-epimerase [Treponema sp.]